MRLKAIGLISWFVESTAVEGKDTHSSLNPHQDGHRGGQRDKGSPRRRVVRRGVRDLRVDTCPRRIASVTITRRGGHGMKVKTKVKAGGFSWSN
jgi:hypothetical protein